MLSFKYRLLTAKYNGMNNGQIRFVISNVKYLLVNRNSRF